MDVDVDLAVPASHLDWSRIQRFSPGEWPPGVLDHMDSRVILVLSRIRNSLPPGASFVPSPVAGAHVRHRARRPGPSDGDRHSTDDGLRLADATDFFVPWEWAARAWSAILADPAVGGAGIYPDMIYGGEPRGRCMFHIDLRPSRVAWVGWREPVAPSVSLSYCMWDAEPKRFLALLRDRTPDGFDQPA